MWISQTEFGKGEDSKGKNQKALWKEWDSCGATCETTVSQPVVIV